MYNIYNLQYTLSVEIASNSTNILYMSRRVPRAGAGERGPGHLLEPDAVR